MDKKRIKDLFNYENVVLITLEEVRELTMLGSALMRQWVNDEVSDDDAMELGTAMWAVVVAWEDGIVEGQHSDDDELAAEARVIHAKLKEIAEAVHVVERYVRTPRYSRLDYLSRAERKAELLKFNSPDPEQRGFFSESGAVWDAALSAG